MLINIGTSFAMNDDMSNADASSNNPLSRIIMRGFLQQCKKAGSLGYSDEDGTGQFADLPNVNMSKRGSHDEICVETDVHARGDDHRELAHEKEYLAGAIRQMCGNFFFCTDHLTKCRPMKFSERDKDDDLSHLSRMKCVTKMPKEIVAQMRKELEKEDSVLPNMPAAEHHAIDLDSPTGLFVQAYYEAIKNNLQAFDFFLNKEGNTIVLRTKLTGSGLVANLDQTKSPIKNKVKEKIFSESKADASAYLDEHTKCHAPAYWKGKSWYVECNTILTESELAGLHKKSEQRRKKIAMAHRTIDDILSKNGDNLNI